jgi:hypothetical protein
MSVWLAGGPPISRAVITGIATDSQIRHSAIRRRGSARDLGLIVAAARANFLKRQLAPLGHRPSGLGREGMSGHA